MSTPNFRRTHSTSQGNTNELAESPFDSPFGPLAADTTTPTRPRLSLGGRARKPRRESLWRGLEDEETGLPGESERPPIPSALAPSGETLSNPLPIVPMIVLSIVSLTTIYVRNSHLLRPIKDNARRILVRKRIHTIFVVYGGR